MEGCCRERRTEEETEDWMKDEQGGAGAPAKQQQAQEQEGEDVPDRYTESRPVRCSAVDAEQNGIVLYKTHKIKVSGRLRNSRKCGRM